MVRLSRGQWGAIEMLNAEVWSAWCLQAVLGRLEETGGKTVSWKIIP